MTQNNAFKKTIRAYMETHNISYTEARKILDEESYLQGTGSITLIVGRSGSGKTMELLEMLKSQTAPTAVLPAHEQEMYSGGTTYYQEPLKSKKALQDLADQKKYSLFAIDGIDWYTHTGETYFLDALPRRADLILTIQFNPIDDISEALDFLDRMELSREKLSQRVKLVKHATDYLPFEFSKKPVDVVKNLIDVRKNRFQVAEYHL